MASGKLVPVSKPFGTAKAVVRKLLICLSYYEGDREAAEDLALLLAELERTRNREADVLLVRRNDAREFSAPVKAKLELKFDRVLTHICRRTDARGYPHGANQMFGDLAMLMAHSVPFATEYYAWLNLESDVVPTRPGWIGELAAQWPQVESAQKAALGYIHDDPTPHLNGMALYAPNLLKRVPQLLGANPQICYDIWHAKRVLPLAESTPLIHFNYRQETITPADLFAVRDGQSVAPCLFHGVKDRSARQAVRARFVTFTETAKPVVIVHKSDQLLAATTIQNPTDFSVSSLEAPKPSDVLLESPLGTQQLACGNRVPVENPTTIRVGLLPSIPPDPSVIVLGQDNPAKRPNVYTYSHKHDGVTKAELAAIVAAWSKGWTSRGWNPVVLTLRDAAKHPKFEEFQAAIEKLPCVGDRKRMAHRFYRWLALDVAGGGLLTDYDVLPQVPPDALNTNMPVCANWAEHYGEKDELLALSLNREESAKWVDTLMKYDAQPTDMLGDKPHVSDKMIASRLLHGTENAVVSIGQLAHFNAERVGNGRKSVAMEKFLEGK